MQSVESAAVSVLRRISMGLSREGIGAVEGRLPVEVANYLQNRKRKELAELESRYGVEITLKAESSLAPGEAELEFLRQEAA